MMNKDILELWGQTLLEMAKVAKGPQAFFEFFQNGFVKKETKPDSLQDQFVEICRNMFGKEGIEKFNEVMKEFYDNIGVVPRAKYNELYANYSDLREKVRELEGEIEKLKQNIKGGIDTPYDLMEQWTKTLRQYSEINQRFFQEFSKFFKP